MEMFESKVRQVGTSLGILIPKEVINEDKIKKNQVIKVAIFKKNKKLIEEYFGSVKTNKKFKRDHKDREF